MTVFDLYAAYYDLLYRDKDYAAETDYLVSLLGAAGAYGSDVLELGCGTGGHAMALAARGLNVHGIDLSPEMVDRALARRRAADPLVQAQLRFESGDVRTFRATSTYGAVLSLFHVVSYQTSNQDQAAVFETARKHLRPGGLFVFDFWHGAGVLSDRPRHVVKEVENSRIKVRRTTTPTMHISRNVVDVHFDVEIVAHEGAVKRLSEHHEMRYLFQPEIEQRLVDHGFAPVATHAWLTKHPLDDRSWYGCTVGRAV